MTSTQQVIDVDDSGFEQDVIERSIETPVLVDFWAPWCGPCRALTPQIESVVAARDGEVVLAKVNVDDAQQSAQRFQITGIPHVKLFSKGREVGHFVGAQNAAMINAFLDQHLGASRFDELLAEHREAGTLGDAVEAFGLGYVEQAFDHLLRDVDGTDDALGDDAKTMLLAAFDQYGTSHPAVPRARKRLATMIL